MIVIKIEIGPDQSTRRPTISSEAKMNSKLPQLLEKKMAKDAFYKTLESIRDRITGRLE